MKVHKANYSKKFSYYIGFGLYGVSCTPMCNSRKWTYSNNSRMWDKVTCKNCLRMREPEGGEG